MILYSAHFRHNSTVACLRNGPSRGRRKIVPLLAARTLAV
jgi:hypothetical protein